MKFFEKILLLVITITLIYACCILTTLFNTVNSINRKLSTIDDRIDAVKMAIKSVDSSVQDVYVIVGSHIDDAAENIERRLKMIQ